MFQKPAGTGGRKHVGDIDTWIYTSSLFPRLIMIDRFIGAWNLRLKWIGHSFADITV